MKNKYLGKDIRIFIKNTNIFYENNDMVDISIDLSIENKNFSTFVDFIKSKEPIYLFKEINRRVKLSKEL